MGAGYIGLEMAEGLSTRGLAVTQLEQLPEVLPTVDAELGALVHARAGAPRCRGPLQDASRPDHRRPSRHPGTRGSSHRPGRRAVPLRRRPRARRDRRAPEHRSRRLRRSRARCQGSDRRRSAHADQPPRRVRGRRLRRHPPSAPRRHLSSPRHNRSQAGTNRRRERPRRLSRLRRQPRHAGRQGLRPRRRPHRTTRPRSRSTQASTRSPSPQRPTTTRPTTPAATGSRCATPATGAPADCSESSSSATCDSEIAKRVDIPATAIFNEMTVDGISDLDLSYTPPLGSPWDALQTGAQAWTRAAGTTKSQIGML